MLYSMCDKPNQDCEECECHSVSRSDMDSEHESTDEPEEEEHSIRMKWAIDGCETLEQIIERLEELKCHYRKLIEDGWYLTGPVDDDWGFIRQNKP